MKCQPAARPKSRLRCLHCLESGCVGPLHGRTPAQRHSASASTHAMIAACASRSGSRLTWKARPTGNEIEAANRAEATALLIRVGYRVYRPEADCYGEDLVLRTPSGKLRAVQLKSRMTVDRHKYGGTSLWMLFPSTKFS